MPKFSTKYIKILFVFLIIILFKDVFTDHIFSGVYLAEYEIKKCDARIIQSKISYNSSLPDSSIYIYTDISDDEELLQFSKQIYADIDTILERYKDIKNQFISMRIDNVSKDKYTTMEMAKFVDWEVSNTKLIYLYEQNKTIIMDFDSLEIIETKNILKPILIESDEQIKKVMLNLTPIGTSLEDVLEIINENEEWNIRSINYEQGFLDTFSDGYYTVGEKSIRAIIGEYENPGLTYVIVFWGFDKDSKLIAIHVRKDVDSL